MRDERQQYKSLYQETIIEGLSPAEVLQNVGGALDRMMDYKQMVEKHYGVEFNIAYDDYRTHGTLVTLSYERKDNA